MKTLTELKEEIKTELLVESISQQVDNMSPKFLATLVESTESEDWGKGMTSDEFGKLLESFGE